MKRPATQFYWADHFRDPGVRASSPAARGIWWDMLCMMHEGEPYGHLTVGGVAPSDEELARMLGESVEVIKPLVAELERKRVFSRTAEGIIFCRRMVRDELKRATHAEAGRLGGNPNLVPNPPDKSGVNSKVKQADESRTNQKPTPSSSSSSSTSKPTTPAVSRYAFMGELRPVWRDAYGGEIPEGSARTLEPLVKKHGVDLVASRLANYLAKTDAQYASIPKFKATFGTWAEIGPRPGKNGDSTLSSESIKW